MATGGDLGRRVAERRRELKLSVEQVAHRAGMSPNYLRLLERNPSVQPSPASLLRLAAALDTTAEQLSGGGMDAPPGQGVPTAPPVLEELDAEECRALVAAGGVGRVVFDTSDGPMAVPVNYRCLGETIVFRSEADSALVPPKGGDEAAFEVDHLDDALTEGWSVLVSGRRELITNSEEAERAWSLGIVPWAPGDRDTLVRIVARSWSGRRIRRRTGGS
jgi:nitroimidazol reductase NimA-like FMN-containing flavoprotein (pyridoxamine 5'-phosphate oxidase superfamily)